jgi:large subunit ribosomal protein L28
MSILIFLEYYRSIMLRLCFKNLVENEMSRKCQVTGKKPVSGYKYAIRGIAKKQKGIGLKITGKTKRRHCPNLLKKRLWFAEENRFVSLKLSAAALRTIDKKGLAAIVKEMRARGEKV